MSGSSVWRSTSSASRGKPTGRSALPSITPALPKEVPSPGGPRSSSATEPPLDNEYWDEHREGIYVDVVTGEPLFTSKDKFDSECGWPAFTKPLEKGKVEERQDTSHGMVRTEVRSKDSGAHLGHVFDEPTPTGHRYCINSAAMRFIPKDDLDKEGYGEYKKRFEQRE